MRNSIAVRLNLDRYSVFSQLKEFHELFLYIDQCASDPRKKGD